MNLLKKDLLLDQDTLSEAMLGNFGQLSINKSETSMNKIESEQPTYALMESFILKTIWLNF